MERAGCHWLHLDIMDNHFVPNLTFGPPVVKALRKVSNKLFFDAHLMVENPLSLVDPFAEAGVQILTLHEETCRGDLAAAIEAVKAAGMRVGMSIKPNTAVKAIEPVLAKLDMVLVMTVEPGFGGQQLLAPCLNKVQQLRRLREQRHHRYCVQVDGGINAKTIDLAVAAGAEVLVAGSAVFAGGKVAENVEALHKAIRPA